MTAHGDYIGSLDNFEGFANERRIAGEWAELEQQMVKCRGRDYSEWDTLLSR